MYLYPPITFPGASDQFRFYYDLVIVITAVAIAIIVHNRHDFAPLVGHKASLSLTVALLVACTLINFSLAAFEITSQPLIWFALVLGGVGTAFMMMMLCEFFGLIHPRRSILYMASGLLLGTIIGWLLRDLSLLKLGICMTLTPLLAALCLWRSYATLSEAERSFGTGSRFSFPWLPLIPIALCAALKRMLMALAPLTLTPEQTSDIGVVAAALIVLVGLMRFGGDLNLRSLWKIGITALGISVVLFIGAAVWKNGILGSGAAATSTVSYYLLFMLMTAILANMSYRYGICALWLFSIEHASRFFAGNITSLGVEGLRDSGSVDILLLDGIFVVAAVASLIAMTYLFRRYSPDSLWGLVIRDEETLSPNDRLQSICSTLAEEYDLTPREEEVLYMRLQGKRPTMIARELFVEVSTVRSHIKHIYAKLNVHSQKELLALGNLPESQ